MAKPFREGLFHWPVKEEKFQLIGNSCRQCQKNFFPPKKICPFCFQDQTMEQLPLSRRGKLESYSVVRQAGPRYSVPYIVAYISLPEKLRVFSQLIECQPQELKIGMEMEIVPSELRRDEKGESLMGYKFRPVKA